MRTLMLLCAALALMWVLPLPVRSQTAEIKPVTFVDVLGGKTLPLSMKIKELDGEWRTFSSGGGAGIEQFFMMMAMNEGMPSVGTMYYTRGRTIAVGTETFLVAYQREKEPFNIQAMMMGQMDEEEPEVEPLTPETELHLSLLNLRTLGTLLDIKTFDMEREMAEGKRAESANRLRQLAVGIMIYAQDHDEMLPEVGDQKQLMDEIQVDEDIWKHPVTGESYRLNAAIGGKALGEIDDPTDIVLCYEATPWPDGKRQAAYLDGHVAVLSEAEWAELE